MLAALTQNPPRIFCRRVSVATIQYEQNTTTHWTSQAGFDFLFHRRWTTALAENPA
jgi:hypothetical protein